MNGKSGVPCKLTVDRVRDMALSTQHKRELAAEISDSIDFILLELIHWGDDLQDCRDNFSIDKADDVVSAIDDLVVDIQAFKRRVHKPLNKLAVNDYILQ